MDMGCRHCRAAWQMVGLHWPACSAWWRSAPSRPPPPSRPSCTCSRSTPASQPTRALSKTRPPLGQSCCTIPEAECLAGLQQSDLRACAAQPAAVLLLGTFVLMPRNAALCMGCCCCAVPYFHICTPHGQESTLNSASLLVCRQDSVSVEAQLELQAEANRWQQESAQAAQSLADSQAACDRAQEQVERLQGTVRDLQRHTQDRGSYDELQERFKEVRRGV